MFRLIILSLFVLHSICDESKEDIVFGESCGTTEWIQKGELDEYDTAECIEATEDSCVNSFLVDFVPGTVEANVYYQVFSDEANLKISILDENDSFIISYEYNKNKHIEGWSHISIPVEQNFRGYVKLQANSFSNDVILVDSIQFIENDTFVPQPYTQPEILKQSVQQNTDEDLILRQFEFNDNDLDLEPEYDNDFDYDSESKEDEDSVPDINLEQNSKQIQEQNVDNEGGTDVQQAAEEELRPELIHEPENPPEAELQQKNVPEVELEPVPELELEPEPEFQPELQSSAEREPRPELDLEPDQQPESVLQTEPGNELEVEPAEELELEPDAEPKTELELEPEINIQPELKPVPKPTSDPLLELKTKPEPEPELMLTPEPKLEPEVGPGLEPSIEPEPEVGQEPEFEPELEPVPEEKLESELDIDPQAEPQPEHDLEIDPKPEGELEPELESELEFEPQVEPELEPWPELEFEPELEPIFGFRSGPEPKLERESDVLYNDSGFWNVWTISLLVLGLAVVVSITAVSAYHCGKFGRQESVLLMDEEEEPRNIIPRVKKAYHNPAYYV